MSYKNTPKSISPGLGGWTYQGNVSLGDPPPAGFYVDQTSMSSGAPTFEINVTDASGISHLDWLQDLVNTNHLILRERNRPTNSLVLEISSNTPGAGFQTIVGDIRSGNGTFEVGVTYDIWEVTTSEDFVDGPASSTTNSVPTFSDTTGKVIQDNPGLLFASSELQLGAATAAIEIQERAAAPASAAAKGHVWVKDDAPNTLTFRDDIGTDYPLHGLEKSVALGTWSFGASTLGTPASGVFDTDNATLGSITAFRFNGTPSSGQAITSWSTLLPQEGVLYFQDTTDPGGTSVTFPYTSVTFPVGASYPQFNGPALGAGLQGANWSANDYSLQIVRMAPTLEEIINGSEVDNDVTVPSTAPIVFSNNAVDFPPLTIIGTNATDVTPSVIITKTDRYDAGFRTSFSGDLGFYFYTGEIQPAANTATHGNTTYYFEPVLTTSGTYHGRDLAIVAGDHTGAQDGGRVWMDAGFSTSSTEGSIFIGANSTTEEITLSTGFSITEGADHPVGHSSTKAQFWLSNDYDETTQASNTVQDGHVLTLTQYAAASGNDIELSWLGANYKSMLGIPLAFGRLEEYGTVGGTIKSSADGSVSYIYDHLSNMWYQSFVDASFSDGEVSSSSDGGYTWETYHTVDTSMGLDEMAPPCTNGTNLGVFADGNFYLSTDLTAGNLPGTATGSPAGITAASTGLVWHTGSQLWVACGDNGTTGYIYTSPAAGTTWTLRYTFPGTVHPKTMDIAHPGYGGYTGNERILIFCGSTGANMYWSDNGTSWTEDTGGNPTTGLEHVVWCPSIGTNNSKDKSGFNGSWLGIDGSKNLWAAYSYGAGNWFDTLVNADWIWKTDEWCGWSTNATATTGTTQVYGVGHVTDTGDGFIRQRVSGLMYYGGMPLVRSSSTTNRARFTWGNGVIMFDREDGELMIGRYGPIT